MERVILLALMACLLSATMAINDGKEEHFKQEESFDVVIGPSAVKIPIGKILLVHKDTAYCAIKFTSFWTGKTQEDRFARYESYYQGDKTGDFSKNNVKVNQEELSSPKPRGIGRFAFSFGNKEVKCGPIKLHWYGNGVVLFYALDQKEGDYGIELAPTPWTDIRQVNVFDPRVKWYRYDEQRKRVSIPVDQLWK